MVFGTLLVPTSDETFERRDVWELSEEDPWHPIIEWYARAVGAMQARDGEDFSDPTSWRYLAAIHGVDLEVLPRHRWPRGATWNECQHNSWFFLPWHRIYLHYFEQVVRQTIADLGGPGDWAIPYWDYSDPERERTQAPPGVQGAANAYRRSQSAVRKREAHYTLGHQPGRRTSHVVG